MDAPSEILLQKGEIREKQNMMTLHDRKFLKSKRGEINEVEMEEKKEKAHELREEVKSMFVMGMIKKKAKGPNPLSMRRRRHGSNKNSGMPEEQSKKRRKRAGTRKKRDEKADRKDAQG